MTTPSCTVPLADTGFADSTADRGDHPKNATYARRMAFQRETNPSADPTDEVPVLFYSSRSIHNPERNNFQASPRVSWYPENSANDEILKTIGYIAISSIIGIIALVGIIIGVLALIFSLQRDVPTGTILLYSGTGSALPDLNNQWLFCDGSAVSRTTYRKLFTVIGTTYGTGNGIDTFNLPDLRARFPLGSQGFTTTTLINGGSSSHAVTIAELPAHSHGQGSLQTVDAGTHTHSYNDPGHNHGGSTGTAPVGSGSNMISSPGGSVSDAGSHSHTISTDTINITIAQSGAHNHTVTGSTGVVGSGQSISIMPPYQTVHYIIRT